MNRELLTKYRTNRCSDKELLQVLAWFEKNAATPDGKTLLYNELWEGLQEEDVPAEVHFDRLLDEIHHKINLARGDSFPKDPQWSNSSLRRKKIRVFLARAAAVLIFPVLGFGIYMSVKYQSEKDRWYAGDLAHQKVSSSVNAISQVSLPDGTRVWLNHSSSISYPAFFNGEARRVELEGEAYFEVVTNPEVPFVVRVDGLEVRAVGTTFNVMAYPEDEQIEVSLLEGSVELHQERSERQETLLLQMKPTDFVRYDRKNGRYKAQTFYDDRYVAWKDGKLVLENASMAELARRLSRWYNVDIHIESAELLELTYTATFLDETLTQVLELLSRVSPIEYSISERERTADGTFSKTIVTIRAK